jgi:hypothetical protein
VSVEGAVSGAMILVFILIIVIEFIFGNIPEDD